MRRSAEHKEIKLFVHLDSFVLPFKQMCTLRVENENGIHLKLQNSKSWVHYYRKICGNGQKGTRLYSPKKKAANPYSIAWKKKSKNKITADVVGHVPREISRAVFFFISRGGKVVGRVLDEKCYPSSILKGGIEILLMVQF